LILLAIPAGIEPATLRVEIRYSGGDGSFAVGSKKIFRRGGRRQNIIFPPANSQITQ
jgi:hypothetical protein